MESSCLIQTSILPIEYREIFPFEYFNAIQSRVFNKILRDNDSLVVCSPTGSGKTVVFELAIVSLLINNPQFKGKILYLAPMKALCCERCNDWNSKFSKHNISCNEITSDVDNINENYYHDSNIICATPERLESLMKFTVSKKNYSEILLCLIDEIHYLGEPKRGIILESLITRIKLLSNNVRFVAASATFDNIDDVAKWLTKDNRSCISMKFGDEYRPIKIQKHIFGYTHNKTSSKSSDYLFDLHLNYKVSKIYQEFSNNMPTLIFCATRKSALMTATILSNDVKIDENLSKYNKIKDAKNFELINKGIAFHHAGLSNSDRSLIEKLFIEGKLKIICCTSTLAVGINLPAYLVIIKSTCKYVIGGYRNYNTIEMLQMIGRAGRPQYTDSAVAVIMTKEEDKSIYENLLSGNLTIESNLHQALTTMLHSECVAGIIHDTKMINKWFESTFLFQRINKNDYYFKNLKVKDYTTLIAHLNKCVEYLKSKDLIMINNEKIQPTKSGYLLNKYNLNLNSFVLIEEMMKNSNDIYSMLMKLCECCEFDEYRLKNSDKKCLNQLKANKMNPIKYKIKGRIKDNAQKICCILQLMFGGIQINNFELQQESLLIMNTGKRLMKYAIEYFSNITCKSYTLYTNLLLLYQSFNAGIWFDSEYIFKQIEKIGISMSQNIVKSGIRTFERLSSTDPRDIEKIVHRNPPFGNQVLQSLTTIPVFSIKINNESKATNSESELDIEVAISNYRMTSKDKKYNESNIWVIGSGLNDSVGFIQKLSEKDFSPYGIWRKFLTPSCQIIKVDVFHLCYVGINKQLKNEITNHKQQKIDSKRIKMNFDFKNKKNQLENNQSQMKTFNSINNNHPSLYENANDFDFDIPAFFNDDDDDDFNQEFEYVNKQDVEVKSVKETNNLYIPVEEKKDLKKNIENTKFVKEDYDPYGEWSLTQILGLQ